MHRASDKLGLYLHIPYCASLCPYCDFAKTANFTSGISTTYLNALQRHLQHWLAAPALTDYVRGGFSSVFLGGGTPSLFTGELEPHFALLAPYLQSAAEVTIEANPDDLLPAKLKIWRDLGVTRLSVGVQTFDQRGLKILGRTHDAKQASQRIADAMTLFPNLNVDLIYGWPGQQLASWEQDLHQVLALGVPHLSLYCLTFEGRTPLGRMAQRGAVLPPPDTALVEAYELAIQVLGQAGYLHEEVSNWAKPGASCAHNWLYWQDYSFIGVGAGAHGYLVDPVGPGLRYAYQRNDRLFSQEISDINNEYLSSKDLFKFVTSLGAQVDETRDDEVWLTELVGAGLRTSQGVDLLNALRRTGKKWQPTAALAEGLAQGALTLTATGRLQLLATEWFREAGWAVEVLRSCR
jgi:oxygen-independent coproporphyrinogen-3 oxidase